MSGGARDDAETSAVKVLPSPIPDSNGDSLPPSSGARVVSAPSQSLPPLAISEPPASGWEATQRPSGEGGGRAELITGIVVAGKYRLERLLRKGGMGSVWIATHLGLDTPVAIKFMTASLLEPPEPGEGSADVAALRAARFEREAKAAAQIRMANVVQVLDYGIDGALPYLVMELLEGEDLGARLAREGRLSPRDFARILTPIARALQRAHDAGLVHRDLKPENIFLAREGEEIIPKILDFGVAKALSGDRRRIGGDSTPEAATPTLEGTVVGSPYYMSPEQALGRTDIDHRSDLWALGVIAFRAVTGRRPFKNDALLEAVIEICTATIPRATAMAPDLPPGADQFFERALAREPGERFQSAKELAAAFAAFAAAPGSAAPGRRLPARRAAFALFAAAILIAAALAAAWLGRASSAPRDSSAPIVEQPIQTDKIDAPAPAPAPAMNSSNARVEAPPEPTAAPIATTAKPRSTAPGGRGPIAPKTAAPPRVTATGKEVPPKKSPSYDLGY